MASTQTHTPTMAVRRATVTHNERVHGGCHRIELSVPPGFPPVRAGQFAMLSLDEPLFPILPRPFSVLGWRATDDGCLLEFLVMPVGRGSGMLCERRPGQTIQVSGPMGHAFDEGLPAGPLVGVAGGYGIAPFVFLLEAWRAAQRDDLVAATTLVFGSRTSERLFLSERVRATGARIEFATDDGSEGFHGRADALLSAILAEERAAMVLTCGPEKMMEAVGRAAHDAGVPCRASLETVMGCGYAVCNGCAVAVDDASQPDGYTYHLACREGTVFDEGCLHWDLV
ncbi:MAG: hypothetical protein H6825_13335 [Planctomycetes bacterium]|nr:hypothetical protein [Planctomycetota bacterium]